MSEVGSAFDFYAGRHAGVPLVLHAFGGDMHIIDTALAKRAERGHPIRVGMIGAGFMARGIALQIIKSCPGIRLVAIANRTPARAHRVYEQAGVEGFYVITGEALHQAIEAGRYSVTNDPFLLTACPDIDVILEVTGHVASSAKTVVDAIFYKKHVVLMNAELDGTVGPILKRYADLAGTIITNCDGDQPGVLMNLFRFVKGLGVKPVLCGNIKGFHDRYKNPTTQEHFAVKWGQSASMITSFTDGTKVSFEQALVANATGMRVAQRGMLGPAVPAGTPITDAVKWFPADLLTGDGIVDYVVGATPPPGVFVIGRCDDKAQQHYLNYYKMGEGPFYVFYTPTHLCHLEVPNTIARAFIFRDAACTPQGKPKVDVIAAAKTDLRQGSVLDDYGHYMTYGLCENADVVYADRLLPIGLVEGCVLNKDIPKDQVLTYDDVTLPHGRFIDRLRSQQDKMFFEGK
jgi:predicted homoserine dehydrogenase-like protein